jgi:AcrR family transcriptional regulator
MKRNSKLPEIRKQELIAAAFKLFSEDGYEKTSVRDILNEVGGEVGMFYHYFKSKDEIFELAVEYFMEQYTTECSTICKGDTVSFLQSLDNLIVFQYESIKTYKEIWSDKIHWSMLSAIYKKTVESIIPYVESLINKAVAQNEISIKAKESRIHDLTLFLVYGISGVLHEKPMAKISLKELSEKQKSIQGLVKQIITLQR